MPRVLCRPPPPVTNLGLRRPGWAAVYSIKRREEPEVARATLNGIVIAESDHTEVIEGNHYFPPDSVNSDYLRESQRHTHCRWKGQARDYGLMVDGHLIEDAAWFYPNPKDVAANIKDHVAFYPGKVEVQG
jgi:uncharacterized protein (DUF427 family)